MSNEQKPNIVLIMTDQQSFNMMSCAGNQYLHTPNMDRLAAAGVRFERAYCTNPVCVPSRFSLMTGKMPSEIGLRWNLHPQHDQVHIPQQLLDSGIGWQFREAGYEVVYGGKTHLPKFSPQDIGFEILTNNDRHELSDACVDYIRQEKDKPFLLFVSFINPHDICYMAIRDAGRQVKPLPENEILALDQAIKMPEGVFEQEFYAKYCPPLPDNYEPQEDEPEIIGKHITDTFKGWVRDNYSDEQWRLHRWAYCRLTERVDAEIGKVCDAVEQSEGKNDTVIIFTSDHGDMDASHRLEHKTVLYDQACRVPMIIAHLGKAITSAVDKQHLVSNGLDLVPTLYDYAGISTKEKLAGMSLRPLVEGRVDEWRNFIPVESLLGRMIVTERYKYILYDEGEKREQLMDLVLDPGEMRNHIHEPINASVVEKHRSLYQQVFNTAIST